MTSPSLAIAAITVLLAACTAPQAPAAPTPPEAPAPAAPPAPPEQAMAKRAPGQEATDPLQVFRAFGTEPFWNVNVEDATLTYTTPDDQAGVVMQGERRALDNGVELAGTHDGTPFTLRVTAGECSDGMSDNQYAMVAAFRYGDSDYKGCAEAAK
jgi:uncharacterized membrane protein